MSFFSFKDDDCVRCKAWATAVQRMEKKATEQHNQIMARLEQLERIIMEKVVVADGEVPCFGVSAIELPSATDCFS